MKRRKLVRIAVVDSDGTDFGTSEQSGIVEALYTLGNSVTLTVKCIATLPKNQRVRVRITDQLGGSWPMFDLGSNGSVTVVISPTDHDHQIAVVAYPVRKMSGLTPEDRQRAYTSKPRYNTEGDAGIASRWFKRLKSKKADVKVMFLRPVRKFRGRREIYV